MTRPVEYVTVPLELLKRVGQYIESVPTGPHPAGVATSLLIELNNLAASGDKVMGAVVPEVELDPAQAKKIAEARALAENAVAATRVKSREERARVAAAAAKRSGNGSVD